MKKFICGVTLIIVVYLGTGCKEKSTEPMINEKDTSTVIERKPNIYIYPAEEINIEVKISFPNVGEIIESIPNYNNGWLVNVKPGGLINNYYGYLFYECKVPDLTQKIYGWIIAKDSLQSFFVKNMHSSGFNQKEINDFIEYWIPLLKDFTYYEIYPQYKTTLEKMSVLEFSIIPENIFRLQYLIKGRDDKNINLPAPQIENAKREGFYIMEWGGILK